MSNSSRSSNRWILALGSAAALCLAAAACGGGSIGVKGQGGLPDLDGEGYGDESSYGVTEDNINRTLEAKQKEVNGEKRIYFYREGSDTPILWATVHDAGGLMFGYMGKRYTVDYGSLRDTYDPEGGAGSLIAGGEMPAGGKVGIAVLEMGDDTSPFMVTVVGPSDSNKAGDLLLARCGAQACEDTPAGGNPYTIKVRTKKIIQTTTLGVNRVTEDGAVNWGLSSYNRASLTAATDDGWGNAGTTSDSGGLDQDKWDSLPPLPETLPDDNSGSSTTANNSSSSAEEEESGGMFSWVSDIDWGEVLMWGAVGVVAWQLIGPATNGKWGDTDVFGWDVFGFDDDDEDPDDKTVSSGGSGGTGGYLGAGGGDDDCTNFINCGHTS